jgi:colanic acid biosynthesis glycosyl transferase WcaI
MHVNGTIEAKSSKNGVGRKPSILFINQHYWPDYASTGQHLTDLAEHMAAVGYDVHVLCSRGGYVAGRVGAPARETRNGVTIRRLGGTAFGRGTHLGRITDYAAFYLQVVLRLLFGRRFDLVVTLTTPPLLNAAAALAKRTRGQAYGVWSMDLHPDAEFALGMLEPDGFAGRGLDRLNGWGYRAADFVVDLGSCMKRRLAAKGVEDERLHTIPVWSREDEVTPVASSENPLRAELGLGNKFVVMYSGNAGLAHCFEEVLEAAAALREHDDIEFLFVGNGPRRAEIEAFAAENDLYNLRYLDYFPREQIRFSLPLGDVHLLTLRPEFDGIAVPGKLYGIMAAGRPVLMVGPEESAPAQTVMQEHIGEVIAPGASDGGQRLARAIYRYYSDSRLVAESGQRARTAFLKHFEQTVTCSAWATLIERYVGHPAPAYRDVEVVSLIE